MNHREAEIKKTLDEDGDSISALPDGILCHILSFLPTTDAVTTTILSTRWKYLFASLPNLDLDDSLLIQPGGDPIDAQCFTNFVYRLLLLRKAPHINRFRLTCFEPCDISHLNAWIRSVLWHNVKELDVTVWDQELPMFPSIDIFTCKTLVDLRLYGEWILLVPISVCLPNVKVLHLRHLKFNDDDTIRRIFSGCLLLEELQLLFCRMESVQTLDISSPSLKSLTFHGSAGDYQIVLNAPVLEYLEVSGFVAEGNLVKDLKSLVTAHLSVGLTENQKGGDSLRYGCYATNLVNAISGSIKLLHLSGKTRKLKLGVDGVNGWKLLPDLLQSAPNLEVLDFTKGFLKEAWELPYHLPERVPICLSQCLKVIVIRKFDGEEVEIFSERWHSVEENHFCYGDEGIANREISNLPQLFEDMSDCA